MMRDESENVMTARQYLRAIEEGIAFEALASFFTPDVVQHEYPNRLRPQGGSAGIEQMREAAARGRQAVAWQRYEVRNAVASGEWVALEVTWTAEVRVEIGSIPAGGQMRAHFAVFLEFRDGKIARQHNYDCFEPF